MNRLFGHFVLLVSVGVVLAADTLRNPSTAETVISPISIDVEGEFFVVLNCVWSAFGSRLDAVSIAVSLARRTDGYQF